MAEFEYLPFGLVSIAWATKLPLRLLNKVKNLFVDTDFINIKNYLCQKTCPLNLLKQKKFWVKLINTKIKEVTEEKT